MLICHVHDSNSMSWGNALNQIRCNLSPCTVRILSDKGSAIKGLVVCNGWDLVPLDMLNGLAHQGCNQPSPEVLIVVLLINLFLLVQPYLASGTKFHRYRRNLGSNMDREYVKYLMTP